MTARKVFVTGGAGYVGSHCCQAFAQAGWEVVVYDNLSRGWADFCQWGPLIRGDILDEAHLTQALRRTQPDVVAHFAALAYVGESVAEPGAYYRTNTAGALNVLSAMRAAGVGTVVFSSTCATYGVPQRTPIDEQHPQQPINPYGWSKLFVERMLAAHAQAHGLRYVALRYFNAAGADPGGHIGERHQPETHVIPLAIRGAMDGGFSFTLHGTDYPTRDGTCMRDYIHVCDLADAHVRAAQHLAEGGASEVFNLGTGTGVTVREVAAAVQRLSGRPLPQTQGPRRPGDPPALVADATKAWQYLGWRPTRSSIDTIVADAWAWHLKDAQGFGKLSPSKSAEPGPPATFLRQ
jgi:UDP-arabinose 4-epimerase